jgi:hypothetical protein
MKIKIFCRCSLFPSWSGYGLISTPVYPLKVHVQTFLSVQITQKCEILSCDTLVANERYVPDFLWTTTAKVKFLTVIWQQKKGNCQIHFPATLLHEKEPPSMFSKWQIGPQSRSDALKDSKSLYHCRESNQNSLTVQAVAHSPYRLSRRVCS